MLIISGVSAPKKQTRGDATLSMAKKVLISLRKLQILKVFSLNQHENVCYKNLFVSQVVLLVRINRVWWSVCVFCFRVGSFCWVWAICLLRDRYRTKRPPGRYHAAVTATPREAHRRQSLPRPCPWRTAKWAHSPDRRFRDPASSLSATGASRSRLGIEI